MLSGAAGRDVGGAVEVEGEDNIVKGAFCKTKIFVQNQGMREILPQAYN